MVSLAIQPRWLRNILWDIRKVLFYAKIGPHLDCSLINSFIPIMVSNDKNASLWEVPSIEEVHHIWYDSLIVFVSNGFTRRFFQYYWSIVSHNVVQAIQNYLDWGLYSKDLFQFYDLDT